jgi:hypothetical protein
VCLWHRFGIPMPLVLEIFLASARLEWPGDAGRKPAEHGPDPHQRALARGGNRGAARRTGVMAGESENPGGRSGTNKEGAGLRNAAGCQPLLGCRRRVLSALQRVARFGEMMP